MGQEYGEIQRLTIHTAIMINKEYENVAPWKKELTRKIGLFGLSDFLGKELRTGDNFEAILI